LAGEGPVYPSGAVSVSYDNGKAVHLVSGQVKTDVKRGRARIEVQVESGGSTNTFVGNGEYAIRRLK
jgi:hypothetical protein